MKHSCPQNIINRKKIISMRQSTGMSQTDVSIVIGASPRFLNDIEGNSTANPSLMYTLRLAAFYGVTVEDIIDRSAVGIEDVIQRKKVQEGILAKRERIRAVKENIPTLEKRMLEMVRDFEETNGVKLSLSYNKKKKRVKASVTLPE